jgi:hypothetical protein
MMTHDDFYVVVAGSAATYRSNNLAQSQVMQFNTIMEPVFDKLGMHLLARNMGMAAPTTVSALGGADVYGEADIFWHVVVEAIDEAESEGQVDLLHKQAILSGERMPVILTPNPVKLLQETNNEAWMGNLQPGADFCERTTAENGKMVLPDVPACHYVNCADDALCDRHNSVCWVERSDYNPLSEQFENAGHQNEGYPNDYMHRLEGRKMAMLVLHALDEALDRWIEQSEQGGIPLPNDLWHVGPVYEQLREKVRTLEDGACNRLLDAVDPQICHMEMHVSSLS